MITSTVRTTITSTISSCAPTITSCPYGKVVTKTVDLYTTVCPASEISKPVAKPTGGNGNNGKGNNGNNGNGNNGNGNNGNNVPTGGKGNNGNTVPTGGSGNNGNNSQPGQPNQTGVPVGPGSEGTATGAVPPSSTGGYPGSGNNGCTGENCPGSGNKQPIVNGSARIAVSALAVVAGVFALAM